MHKLKIIFKNIFLLTIPSIIIAFLILEIFIRITWNQKEGTPGLVLTHPTRIETLAPNYTGYFVGQPLKINNLGFRDDQDYSLKKSPNTYRIIILGDSVTFGHGCKFNETWPYILKKRLQEWNSNIDWQVWNLGVPGYDNVLELRTLQELGPKYKPDLVIVGFYENDLFAWNYHSKQQMSSWAYFVKRFLKTHLYLYTKLRFAYNVIANLKAGEQYQCQREEMLISKPVKEIEPFNFSKFNFKHNLPDVKLPPETKRVFSFQAGGVDSLTKSILEFKKYNDEGKYKIIFFINIAPDVDAKNNIFVDGIHNEMNNYFRDILKDFPTLSSYDAFWAYKPSEVPDAGTHSLASANMVKADILFDFLVKNIISDKSLPKK